MYSVVLKPQQKEKKEKDGDNSTPGGLKITIYEKAEPGKTEEE